MKGSPDAPFFRPCDKGKMRLSHLSFGIVSLAVILLLDACSAPKVDPDLGVPTGIQYVIAKYGDGGENLKLAARVRGMAVQYPRRPAFEAAVMQQIRTGDLRASKLEVTYVEGSAKVFKQAGTQRLQCRFAKARYCVQS